MHMPEEVTPMSVLWKAAPVYLDKPVPQELVQQLLVEARWAPSSSNTQSTYVYALSGKPFKKFKADLLKNSEDEIPSAPDLAGSPQWTGKYEARRNELMRIRSTWCAAEEERMGLEPQPMPANPLVAGAAIFGAPLLLLLAIDKDISAYTGCFDAGLFAMALTLAAHERGLGTCIATSVVRYGDLVRKHVPGLDDKNVVTGVALGYPDPEAPVNRFPRTRVLEREYLTFVE
jgi:nitroreductase